MRIFECETEETYSENFNDPKFGVDESRQILASLGIESKDLHRKVEGSSLLFRVNDNWLKLTPPFWTDAVETEKKLLKHFANRLSLQIPQILHEGDLFGWKFVLLSHVEGTSFANIHREFGDLDRDRMIEDLARLVQEVIRVAPIELNRSFGDWRKFAGTRLRDLSFHKEKSVSDYWVDQISSLLNEVGPAILALDDYRIIHADLNHEHILFQKSTCWCMSGLIDFADGMLAPKEIELILPFLVFFRADKARQKRLLSEIGFGTKSYAVPFSHLMMGLTLCNRFLHFEEWFSREIKREGLKDIREIAEKVFA